MLVGAIREEGEYAAGAGPEHLAILIGLASRLCRLLPILRPAGALREVVVVAPHLADTILWLTPTVRRMQVRIDDRLALLPGIRPFFPITIMEQHIDLPVGVTVHHIGVLELLFYSIQAHFVIDRASNSLPYVRIVIPHIAEAILWWNLALRRRWRRWWRLWVRRLRRIAGLVAGWRGLPTVTGVGWGWVVARWWWRWLRMGFMSWNAYPLANVDDIAVVDVIDPLQGLGANTIVGRNTA